jgi:hypothetical protein
VREPLITRADFSDFKEVILNYQQWRKMHGLPESEWWNQQLRSGLENMGLLKPRNAADRRIEPTRGDERREETL